MVALWGVASSSSLDSCILAHATLPTLHLYLSDKISRCPGGTVTKSPVATPFPAFETVSPRKSPNQTQLLSAKM